MTRAFAPGHVSGLFAVHDEAEDPLARGSRGGGWSLELGATAHVERASETSIHVNGRKSVANVTRLALHRLAPDVELAVDIRLDLPVGQGFGMSAAGSLAACLAAASHLGLEAELALASTHTAEVESGTGLGDAVAAWQGGGELRLRPGVPPHGQLLRVDAPGNAQFLLVELGAPIETPTIIQDPAWKEATRLLGDAGVDRVVAAGRARAWQALLQESMRFSQDLGLMPQGMRDLGGRLPPGTLWGQAMLGSTMWVAGDARSLDEAEAHFGSHARLRMGVDAMGARILRD